MSTCLTGTLSVTAVLRAWGSERNRHRRNRHRYVFIALTSRRAVTAWRRCFGFAEYRDDLRTSHWTGVDTTKTPPARAVSPDHPKHGSPMAERFPDTLIVASMRTIGHGTRTTDELVALLRRAEVATVIDVRRYPQGRRQPHLSAERLSDDLPAAGVGYEWWGEALGGRRAADPSALAASAWRMPAFAAYEAHMATAEFRSALVDLERRAQAGESLAIMCAETVWWRCHRRLIADALTQDGFVVEHLIDRVPGRPHRSPDLIAGKGNGV